MEVTMRLEQIVFEKGQERTKSHDPIVQGKDLVIKIKEMFESQNNGRIRRKLETKKRLELIVNKGSK